LHRGVLGTPRIGDFGVEVMKVEPDGASGNVLDFALETFSANDEQDLYQVVKHASTERIGSTLDKYRTWASSGVVRAPLLAQGELRPYFVTSSGLVPWARGGIDIKGGLQDQTAMWAAVDSIKHRLLYCHSVAIDDAFGELLDRTSRDETGDARDRLLNYINFLIHMAPLLRGNILCPVTSDLYLDRSGDKSGSHWTTVKDRLSSELRTDVVWSRSSLAEFLREAPEDVRHTLELKLRDPDAATVLRQGLFQNSCERVGRALAACANAPDRLTAYLPFRYDINVLSAFQGAVSDRDRSELSQLQFPDYDNWLLEQLIDIELPCLDELQPIELVQIRMASSEFDEWRGTLRSALRNAENAVPPDTWGRNRVVRAVLNEQLLEGKKRLDESLPRGKFRNALKPTTVTMLGGVLAAGLSMFVDPTMTIHVFMGALAAAAASPVFSAAIEAGSGKHGQARRAAQAHYLAVLR